MRLSSVFAAVLITCAACASGGTSPAATETSTESGRSSYVLGAREIEAHSDLATAYDLIRRLRPTFKGTVYLDNVRYGNFASMRQISAGNVREIRQLNEGDAAQRFGTGAGWVILITSR